MAEYRRALNLARIAFDEHEVQISIVANPRRGLWANTIAIKHGRSFRTAGSLPTEANRHTLLSVALTTALRSVNRNQAEMLVTSASEPIKKPRVRLFTQDETFAEALSAAIKREAGKPLKVGKNFVREMARQAVRFDLQLVTLPTDDALLATLQAWGRTVVIDPKQIEQIPAALVPAAVSALI